MSRIALPFAAVLAVAVAVAAADDKPKPAAKNILANGNMEDVAGGKPAKWTAICAEGGKIDLASSDAQPKEGKRCMLVKGGAEWGVVHSEKIPADRTKTYTLTGFVRVKSGTARIKFDYFQGDNHLGMTETDDIPGTGWQRAKVVSELDNFPNATHFTACAVVFGEFEASFDDFVLTAAGPAADKAEVEKETKKFQGTWTFESSEAGGQKMPADELKTLVLTFEGAKHTVLKGTDVIQTGTQTIDPSKSPKAIDVTITEGPSKGTVMLGIYEIDGDTLTVCFDFGGKTRPTEFKSPAGSQTFLNVHKRAKK